MHGIDFIQGPAGKNEIFVNCPFCEKRGKGSDTKYHLGVNTTKGVYHCFRCDAAGRLKDVRELAMLAPVDPSRDLDAIRFKLKNMFESSTPKDVDLDEISWALDSGTPMAYKYMIDRGFTPQDIIKYNLRVGRPYFDYDQNKEINKYSGRIIFPFMSEGKCVYFCARSINGGEPKYLNSEGSKSFLVYNIDNVVNECIICEGVISSIAAERATGVPCVAILGKAMSLFQLTRIRSKCNKVYLSLDGDTGEESAKLLKRLVSKFDEVYYVKLPNEPNRKDPDQIGTEYKEFFQKAERIRLISN